MSNRFFKLKRIVLILTVLNNVSFWSRVYIELYLSILRSCFVSLISCLFLFCLRCWRFLVKVAFFVVLFLFVIITSSLRALQVVVRYTSKPVKHNPIPPLLANPVNFGQFWKYVEQKRVLANFTNFWKYLDNNSFSILKWYALWYLPTKHLHIFAYNLTTKTSNSKSFP